MTTTLPDFCVARAGIGSGVTEFSLAPLGHRDLVSYDFATHDMSGLLTYQNIDLVIRGAGNALAPTQFLHARGARRGVVRLGRGNTGEMTTTNIFFKKKIHDCHEDM